MEQRCAPAAPGAVSSEAQRDSEGESSQECRRRAPSVLAGPQNPQRPVWDSGVASEGLMAVTPDVRHLSSLLFSPRAAAPGAGGHSLVELGAVWALARWRWREGLAGG